MLPGTRVIILNKIDKDKFPCGAYKRYTVLYYTSLQYTVDNITRIILHRDMNNEEDTENK